MKPTCGSHGSHPNRNDLTDFARVAEHNTGSAKVVVRAGFVRVGAENSYANGVGRQIVEHIYQLER